MGSLSINSATILELAVEKDQAMGVLIVQEHDLRPETIPVSARARYLNPCFPFPPFHSSMALPPPLVPCLSALCLNCSSRRSSTIHPEDRLAWPLSCSRNQQMPLQPSESCMELHWMVGRELFFFCWSPYLFLGSIQDQKAFIDIWWGDMSFWSFRSIHEDYLRASPGRTQQSGQQGQQPGQPGYSVQGSTEKRCVLAPRIKVTIERHNAAVHEGGRSR
jgi:hypothetical protein